MFFLVCVYRRHFGFRLGWLRRSGIEAQQQQLEFETVRDGTDKSNAEFDGVYSNAVVRNPGGDKLVSAEHAEFTSKTTSGGEIRNADLGSFVSQFFELVERSFYKELYVLQSCQR